MGFKIIVIIFIITITLIFLGFILSIVFLNSNFNKIFKKQDEKFNLEKLNMQLQMDETELTSKEEERERIANNFHDDINPLFAALKYQLRLNNLNDKEQRLKHDNKQISSLIDKIIENQHVALGNKVSRIQTIGQLSFAIEEYLNCLSCFKINFETEIFVKSSSKSEIFNNLYSVFLELMHNIMKHEKIEELNIHLNIDDISINLIFKHNGMGLTNEQFEHSIKIKEGRGLKSIQTRLNYICATINFLSLYDGAIIQINLPLKNV
jgi:signal transduction histidine kinase